MKLVYSKNYSKSCKNISFQVIQKWQQIKQSAPGLNEGLSPNFSAAEKCKSHEIYKRKCNVYGEACFSFSLLKKKKKRFTNRLNANSLLQAWVIEIIHRVETHTIKEKFQAQQSVKMLTFFSVMKGTITIYFLEKGATINSASYRQLVRQNSPLFIEWPWYIEVTYQNYCLLLAKKHT